MTRLYCGSWSEQEDDPDGHAAFWHFLCAEEPSEAEAARQQDAAEAGRYDSIEGVRPPRPAMSAHDAAEFIREHFGKMRAAFLSDPGGYLSQTDLEDQGITDEVAAEAIAIIEREWRPSAEQEAREALIRRGTALIDAEPWLTPREVLARLSGEVQWGAAIDAEGGGLIAPEIGVHAHVVAGARRPSTSMRARTTGTTTPCRSSSRPATAAP